MMKNRSAQNNLLTKSDQEMHSTVYTTVVSLEGNEDWSAARAADGSLIVTDLSNNESSIHNIQDYIFDHNSLMDFKTDSDSFRIQLQSSRNDLEYKFIYQGGNIDTLVYDAN